MQSEICRAHLTVKLNMKGGEANKPQPAPDPANLDQSELASNQQVKCVPWLAGEQVTAATWISPLYDQFSRDAPGAGKK